MKPYRTGIAGAGFGATSHLPALQNHPRFEVVAIASPRSALDVARREGVPHAFASCAEMLAACELEAVIVASPPFAHCDDVLAALAARKHVLCEKPFTTSLAAAARMAEAALLAGTACGVVHEFRFVPQAHALKELIVNGHLAHVRNIEITMLRHTLRRHERRERSWWFERERGGGLAGAILSHLIDQANGSQGVLRNEHSASTGPRTPTASTRPGASRRASMTARLRSSISAMVWSRVAPPTQRLQSNRIRARCTASG